MEQSESEVTVDPASISNDKVSIEFAKNVTPKLWLKSIDTLAPAGMSKRTT